MVGEITFVGKDVYVKVNKQGTLEKLKRLSWFRCLQLYIKNQINPMQISEVRKFVIKHTKHNVW